MFLVMFFPSLLMAIGPGIVQTTMMTECRDVNVTIETENVPLTDMQVLECRVKENYYGDFGDWYISGNTR